MNDMAKIDLSQIPVEDKIVAMCRSYPTMHSREIARIVGATVPNVSKVRSMSGLRRMPDGQKIIEHFSEENRYWIEGEAEKLGVPMIRLLDAIITDARNGD